MSRAASTATADLNLCTAAWLQDELAAAHKHEQALRAEAEALQEQLQGLQADVEHVLAKNQQLEAVMMAAWHGVRGVVRQVGGPMRVEV